MEVAVNHKLALAAELLTTLAAGERQTELEHGLRLTVTLAFAAIHDRHIHYGSLAQEVPLQRRVLLLRIPIAYLKHKIVNNLK